MDEILFLGKEQTPPPISSWIGNDTIDNPGGASLVESRLGKWFKWDWVNAKWDRVNAKWDRKLLDFKGE